MNHILKYSLCEFNEFTCWQVRCSVADHDALCNGFGCTTSTLQQRNSVTVEAEMHFMRGQNYWGCVMITQDINNFIRSLNANLKSI